jgi:hypothetical protein
MRISLGTKLRCSLFFKHALFFCVEIRRGFGRAQPAEQAWSASHMLGTCWFASRWPCSDFASLLVALAVTAALAGAAARAPAALLLRVHVGGSWSACDVVERELKNTDNSEMRFMNGTHTPLGDGLLVNACKTRTVRGFSWWIFACNAHTSKADKLVRSHMIL